MTGTYTLQSSRSVFNQYTVDPTCQLCGQGSEDKCHFLAKCPSLQHTREQVLHKLEKLIPQDSYNTVTNDDDILTRLMIDPSSSTNLYDSNGTNISNIELWARESIYNLHVLRAQKLAILGLNNKKRKRHKKKKPNMRANVRKT